MKRKICTSGLALGICCIVLSSSISVGYNGNSSWLVQNDAEMSWAQQPDDFTSRFSLNVYGRTSLKNRDVDLTSDDALEIFDLLRRLNTQMTQEPFSDKTQLLKQTFVDLLAEKGVISDGIPKEAYRSLLSPRWIERLQRTNTTGPLPRSFEKIGTSIFCSIGGEGTGVLLPLFLLPRPRIAMMWIGTGISTAANLITGNGYVAGGAQSGFALGFMGIGLSYALPGYTLYGFIGYALLASTTAMEIEHYPPNRAPVISDITPTDGEQNAPVSLSELQFRIHDPDGDLMSYSVTTEPDIGSANGVLKPFGTYSVPISGLQSDTIYRWTIEVSDSQETTKELCGFFTEGRPPFDPFSQGWSYRKEITIDHTLVSGELTQYPLLISGNDQDLRDKTQSDGGDILFMDDTGVATKLPHELEQYQSSTGMLTAWVQLPVLRSTEDTVLYMYYGNPSSPDQQFPEKVWNSDFKAVWHLNTNPSGEIFDSTAKNNDGTAKGGMTSSDLVNGKIGPCLDFDGLDDAISFSEFTDSMDAGSCIAWVQTTSTNRGAVWAEANMDEDKPYIVLGKYQDDLLSYARDIYGANTNYQGRKPTTINDGLWHQVAWSSKGSGKGNVFYFDGQPVSLTWQDGLNPNGIWFDDQSTDTHSIGALDRPTNDWLWTGPLDEIRIADTAFSSAWIATEYANHNTPENFITIGPEESGP